MSADAQAELLERLRRATLGEYEILAQIGFGGMASVYLAHDIALDRKVAIKLMSPAMIYGQGLVERFRLEAKTAAALSHPNIIPIYAVREAQGLLFFVMKLVGGTSLDAVIDEVGPLPIPMVEGILAQAGGALGYAHRHGVIHRDVKPANILLDEEGWVVVTDFGIAKVADTSALTMTGMAVGTPTYMSPEQCSGGLVGAASDQYSLGVVAYEMLAGRPPFVEQSIPALMLGHTTRDPPPLGAVRPDCPPALLSAVNRMLAKDPADRFGSLEEAITAAEARALPPDDSTRGTLVALAQSSGTRRLIAQVRTPRSPVPMLHRSGSQGETPTAPPPRRTGLLVGGGLAVGIGLTAAVALLLQRGPAPPSLEPTTAPLDSVVAAVDSAPAGPAEAPQGTRPAPPPPPPLNVAPPPAPPTSRPPAPSAAARPSAVDSVLTRITPQIVASAPATESTAAPAPAPAPPPAVPPPPPPPPDPRAEVEATVQAYARALEAGRVDLALRLYPSMPADQRQGLEAFYRDGGSMQTRWRVVDVAVTGSSATLRIEGTNQVRTARAAPSEQRVALRARLERGPDGWRLVALVN